MGKTTGFMEFKRLENGNVPPLVRIENFKEFHPKLDEAARREQAARCMNCGVPMCQSAIKLAGMVTGCPLHNYIPEWNDALYNGQFDMAAWRLLKTSSFPEFTGRVCPALCEKACNLENDAVTIHDNELFIIEKAFETGYMKPTPPVNRCGKKVAVIGSGPSGLAVADWLNRRGYTVTVYEREDRAGGLLMYGIPNMKLDKSIIERRINFMKAEGVNFIFNADVGKNYSAQDIMNNYDAVALCCGAKKARPLSCTGIDKLLAGENGGLMFAVDFLTKVTKSVVSLDQAEKTYKDNLVITNDNINLSLEKNGIFVKGKDVIVLGGGDTGNDCTGTCIRLGCKSVTQLEMMPEPPKERTPDNPWPQWPKVLKTDYGAEESIAKFGHDPRVFKTTIKEIYSTDGKVTGVKTVQVEFKNVDGQRKLVEIEGSEKELAADLILVAAGFLGCEEYTPQAFGTALGQRGTVTTLETGYQTENPKIFSAGDMHRGQSLVVWAIAEGRECAQQIDRYLVQGAK
ncbi:MAG: glutamate synthase subunit beta [Treponema sp.]|nr:glutamate synthase subunit beta [Treponema sp.]